MKIAVAILVMNQKEVTQQCLDLLRSTETENLPLILVDNGSTEPIRDWLIGLREGNLVIRNEANRGVRPAMNQVWHIAKDLGLDYIFFVHNDVMVYEKGWDKKIIDAISFHNEHLVNGDDKGIGVAGFFGAKGLGVQGIYRRPYQMQDLIRIENVSGCTRMDAAHGYRAPRGDVEDVATLDGFSLIVSVELLNKLNGFDDKFPVHHNYDNDICMESLDKGYRNVVIKMDAQHLGGRTDVGEDWATPMGTTKQQVHIDAHPVLYEKWRPEKVQDGTHKICLPVRII